MTFDILQFLINAGVDPLKINICGQSGLLLYMKNTKISDIKVVKMFLDLGLDVNQNSVIKHAMKNNKITSDCIEYLIINGADCTIT